MEYYGTCTGLYSFNETNDYQLVVPYLDLMHIRHTVVVARLLFYPNCVVL